MTTQRERVITSLDVLNLHCEYPLDKHYHDPRGRITGGVISFAVARLSNGLVGLGPGYTHPDVLRVIVETQLSPMLVGREFPTDLDELWDVMYAVTQWYGRGGATVSAIGAVDNALWDLKGKLADRPVHQLLGGRRSTVPVYASGLLWDDPTELQDKASALCALGYRRLKMRTGVNPDHDEESVEMALRGLGDDCELIVDGGQRYPLEAAIRFGTFLAERKVVWFEEPFRPDDIDSYAALRRSVSVPLAAGEHEVGVNGFRELLRAGCIDIVQPDVSRVGGITAAVRVARLAERHEALVATHTWGDAASVLANAQVVAAVPNGMTVEWNETEHPFYEELLTARPPVLNGELILPDAPGLGFELSDEAIERFAVPRDELVRPGHYSDMTFGPGCDWQWPPFPIESIPERPAEIPEETSPTIATKEVLNVRLRTN